MSLNILNMVKTKWSAAHGCVERTQWSELLIQKISRIIIPVNVTSAAGWISLKYKYQEHVNILKEQNEANV